MSGFADSINRSQQHIDSIASSLGDFFKNQEAKKRTEQLNSLLSEASKPKKIGEKTTILPSPPLRESPKPPSLQNNINIANGKLPNQVQQQSPVFQNQQPSIPSIQSGNQYGNLKQETKTEPVFGEKPTQYEALSNVLETHPEIAQYPEFANILSSAKMMHDIQKSKNTFALIDNPNDSSTQIKVRISEDGKYTPIIDENGVIATVKKDINKIVPRRSEQFSALATMAEQAGDLEGARKYKAMAQSMDDTTVNRRQRESDVTKERMQWLKEHTPRFTVDDSGIGRITQMGDDGKFTTTKVSSVPLGKTNNAWEKVTDSTGAITSIVSKNTGKILKPEDFGVKNFKDPKLTANMLNKVTDIHTVKNEINYLVPEIDRLSDRFGAIAGRFNSFFVGKIGLDDPELKKLYDSLHLVQTKMQNVHFGGRGSNMIAKMFDDMIGTENQSPENIKATLSAIDRYLDENMMAIKDFSENGVGDALASDSNGKVTQKAVENKDNFTKTSDINSMDDATYKRFVKWRNSQR